MQGIRVLDFGHYLPGPLVGMLLADQGAEVVKVDRPGHPDADTAGADTAGGVSPADAVLNRGKQRLELDLKTAHGVEAARTLARSADVLIENFRPGVMARLGLGPEELTAANPGLVYLSLPGFFSDEEGSAALNAYEGVVAAATGLFTDLHMIRRRMEAPPVYTPLPLCSAYAAVHGASAVTLALYAREESGRGNVIEVPLSGAMMSAMGGFVLQLQDPTSGLPRPFHPADHPLSDQIRHADDAEQQRLVDSLRDSIPPAFDSFPTADGRWAFVLANGNARHSRQYMKALGIYDRLIADGMVDRYPYDDLTCAHNVSALERLSPEWRRLVRERIAAAYLQKPAAEWTEIMRAHGVPFSVHRTAQEWLHDPATAAAALTVEVDDPRWGRVRQFGLQTTLARTAAERIQPRPARWVELDTVLAAWNDAVGRDGADARPPTNEPAVTAAAAGADGVRWPNGVAGAGGATGEARAAAGDTATAVETKSGPGATGGTAGCGALGEAAKDNSDAGEGPLRVDDSGSAAAGIAEAGKATAAAAAGAAAPPPARFTAPGEPHVVAGGMAADAAAGVHVANGRGILAGVKVLDLSTVLAGPCCARTLAEYGAEVIKIDHPRPYFGPWTTCYAHIEVSQGKRSMILDLKQPAGKEIFDQLAADTDVIVHNLRPGVDERLGIDYRTVARINPDVVYLSLTAFDGPRPGPWSGLPGFDPVLQAATGIQLRYGGAGNRPELHGFAATIDYLTGYSGVFGIALALLQRRRAGGGDFLKTSLAQGGQLAQATLMWSTARQRPDREPQGQTAKGEGALQHLYEASDGWLFVAAPAAHWVRLRAVPELAAVAGAGPTTGIGPAAGAGPATGTGPATGAGPSHGRRLRRARRRRSGRRRGRGRGAAHRRAGGCLAPAAGRPLGAGAERRRYRLPPHRPDRGAAPHQPAPGAQRRAGRLAGRPLDLDHSHARSPGR